MRPDNIRQAISSSPYIYLIGVAGDSGSGKSTFSRAIVEIFGEDLVSTITVDDYHLLDRKERAEQNITPLNYSANNLDLLCFHLRELKAGKPITKPVYSHEDGTFKLPEVFNPTKFILIEGLHPYATEELRLQYDYTIFVDPEKNVKYDWKTKRDIQVRNYDRDTVLAEIALREPDYLEYVVPQRRVADAVIQICYSQYGQELGSSRNIYKVILSMTAQDYCFEDLELNIDLCDLFKSSAHNFSLSCMSHTLDRRLMRALSVDGELLPETILKIEHQIEDQTGVSPIDIFHSQDHITGTDVIRLIVSWQIINSRIRIAMNRQG